jgi:hypothetical protein
VRQRFKVLPSETISGTSSETGPAITRLRNTAASFADPRGDTRHAVLLGERGVEDPVVRIPEGKPEHDAVNASRVQSLRTGEQHPTDLVERVVLPTAMAQGLVLDPAANVIDTTVRSSDDLRGVSHLADLVEVRRKS